MSLALYRKYRPATFAELKGQEHVAEPLQQALRNGRIHHAYLFSGPRGCGKTSSARILARSLNCEAGPTPEPCGKCESCLALGPTGSGHIDVIEIDAASHGGVDDARDLRERAFFAPVAARYKIYIIDEAHMVTREGFNALLKLVEEPPSHLKFIFATTEPEKVIGTIRSRTHHYPFRLIPPGTLRELLEEILQKENVPYEPAAIPLVVRAGAGSARDSESILDQLLAGAGEEGITYARAVSLLGYTDATLLDEVVDAVAARDGGAVFAAIDRVMEGGQDPRRFAADLLERFRDLVILSNVPDSGTTGLLDVPPDELERMQAQASRLGLAELTRAADLLHTGLTEMRGATAPRLLLELICARILLPGAYDDEASLLARLDRLERRMAIGEGAPVADMPPVRRPQPTTAPADHPAPAQSPRADQARRPGNDAGRTDRPYSAGDHTSQPDRSAGYAGPAGGTGAAGGAGSAGSAGSAGGLGSAGAGSARGAASAGRPAPAGGAGSAGGAASIGRAAPAEGAAPAGGADSAGGAPPGDAGSAQNAAPAGSAGTDHLAGSARSARPGPPAQGGGDPNSSVQSPAGRGEDLRSPVDNSGWATSGGENSQVRAGGSGGSSGPGRGASGVSGGSGGPTGSSGGPGGPSSGGASTAGRSGASQGHGSNGVDWPAPTPPGGQAQQRPDDAYDRPQQQQAAQPPQPGGVDVGAIRRMWVDILEAVKQRSKVAWIVLMEGVEVASLEGNVLTLAFANEGKRRGFTTGGKDVVLREALKEILGVDWRIDAVLDNGSGQGGGGRPSPPPPTTPEPGGWGVAVPPAPREERREPPAPPPPAASGIVPPPPEPMDEADEVDPEGDADADSEAALTGMALIEQVLGGTVIQEIDNA